MGVAAKPAQGDSLSRFDRAQIVSTVERVLHRGGWGNPDVLLVRDGRSCYVVKDFSPRSGIVRFALGRFLLRREAAAYVRLVDHPAVPRLLGWVDRDAFVLEYRPGVLLSRSLAGKIPEPFLDELSKAVDAMHASGVVHLDLRHRSNILAGEDGHPVVLDFASSLRFDPKRRVGRLGIRLFGWIDRLALRKWQVRLHSPSQVSRGLESGASLGGGRP